MIDQGFVAGVAFWTAVARGWTGAAPPMISSTVLAAGLVSQMFPEMSMAMADEAVPVLLLLVERGVPDVETEVREPLLLVIQRLLLPSKARAVAPDTLVGA